MSIVLCLHDHDILLAIKLAQQPIHHAGLDGLSVEKFAFWVQTANQPNLLTTRGLASDRSAKSSYFDQSLPTNP